jgi:hypothetical protein
MLRKFSKILRAFADNAIDYVMAAGKPCTGISAFTVTQVGTSPCAVLLSTYGLPNMADTDYQVIVNGETVAATSVDESSKTVSGFSILGGANNEIYHVVVIGRFAGMPARPSHVF